MYYLNCVMLLFLSLLVSCEDEVIETEIEVATVRDTIFELFWASRLDYSREIVSSQTTQHYGSMALVTGDKDDPPTLIAFDKKTGDRLWEYVHMGVVKSRIYTSYVYGSLYIAMCYDGLIAIDLNGPNVVWETSFSELDYTFAYGFELLDEKLYFSSTQNLREDSRTSHIIRLDPPTGQMDIVHSTTSGTRNPPVFADTEQGYFIILNEYPWSDGAPPQENVQNIVCIDLESGEEVWRQDSITDFFRSNVIRPMVIYDNRIAITGGDWSIYAFDVMTGERLWRREFEYPWSMWNKTDHLLHGNRLYVNNDLEDVTCLNPETGAIIWNNPQGGANCTDNMLYYEKEDYLVFTSWGYASVMVLDAITGETVHREAYYDNSEYNTDVVYDSDLDMFFTSTYKHAVGFKIRGRD